MGILSMLGLGGVKAAGEGVGAVVNSVGGVLDSLFTSDEERMEADRLMKKIDQRPQEAQWKINATEASHRSAFVAGWRPAIGWVCAIALFTYYVPQFSIGSWLWAKQCLAESKVVPYPLVISDVMGLVTSLLGMAGLRTVEKLTGKAK